MASSWRATLLAPAEAVASPGDPGAVVRYRVLLLSCIFCGLTQKPLISFAWDMQSFEDAVRELRGRKTSLALLGGTAILLRQVFASRAQVQVKSMALALADAGSTWKAKDLQTLLKRLVKLLPRDSGKRRGRMSQFTGPSWIRKLLLSPKHLKRFL